MTVPHLTEKLGLHSLRNRSWYIQASCALTGEGLTEGLEWLREQILAKTQGKRPPERPNSSSNLALKERGLVGKGASPTKDGSETASTADVDELPEDLSGGSDKALAGMDSES